MVPMSQEVTESGTGDAIVDQGTAAATAGGWPVKVTDGTNVSAVKAASTAPLATDPALVVVISPNQAALPVTSAPGTSTTATLTNITSANSNTALLASNSSRKGWLITNDSTALLYVNLGGTASATAYTLRLQPNSFYESSNPVYTGAINGLWAAANGFARMTELT